MNSGLRKLKSEDGQVFEVEESCLSLCRFFQDLMNEYPDPDQEININQVDGKNLSKIIEYLRHYEIEKPKKIPKPLPNSDLKPLLNQWDYNFINSMSLEECIDLVNAANFLYITELVNLACAKLASEMMNGPIEQVREKFGIKSDMTEEEMKKFEKYKLD
jgi:S-phase kinase-associated protein 1